MQASPPNPASCRRSAGVIYLPLKGYLLETIKARAAAAAAGDDGKRLFHTDVTTTSWSVMTAWGVCVGGDDDANLQVEL